MIIYTHGIACVRQKGDWWNISVLFDGATSTIIGPSKQSEVEAKGWVEDNYPNCTYYVSSADMVAELGERRKEVQS